MRLTYYINYVAGHHGSPDRIAGQPTHQPPAIPTSTVTGEPLGFILQIYSASVPGLFDDILGMQLYGAVDIEEPDRTPQLVVIAKGAPLYSGEIVPICDGLEPVDLSFQKSEEPDQLEFEYNDQDLEYYRSKLGGAPMNDDWPDPAFQPIAFVESEIITNGLDIQMPFPYSAVIAREGDTFHVDLL